jgi:hypothetical protein
MCLVIQHTIQGCIAVRVHITDKGTHLLIVTSIYINGFGNCKIYQLDREWNFDPFHQLICQKKDLESFLHAWDDTPVFKSPYEKTVRVKPSDNGVTVRCEIASYYSLHVEEWKSQELPELFTSDEIPCPLANTDARPFTSSSPFWFRGESSVDHNGVVTLHIHKNCEKLV